MNIGCDVVDPLEWAHRLRRRELAGERLTAAQRAAWRSALRPGAVIPDNGLKGDVDQRREETQRRVDAYLQR